MTDNIKIVKVQHPKLFLEALFQSQSHDISPALIFGKEKKILVFNGKSTETD